MRLANKARFPRLTTADSATVRASMCAPSIGLIGLVGMILVLLVGPPGTGLAEPANELDGAVFDLALLVTKSVTSSVDGTQVDRGSAESADASERPGHPAPADDLLPGTRDAARAALPEPLFSLRPGANLWRPQTQTTDEILAATLAGGSNPDLERPNPFRKRSRDLFRTERPVSIGDADMVLRLRLRARINRAVAVELRF